MKKTKAALILILFICLLGLMTYCYLYKNTYDPGLSYRLDHFEEYKDEPIAFSGIIQKIDTENNTLIVEVTQPPYIDMTVITSKIPDDTKQGDIVEILASFHTPNIVHAEKIIVTHTFEYYLIYLRSLPAIPFALYFFFKNWRFNKKTWYFEWRMR